MVFGQHGENDLAHHAVSLDDTKTTLDGLGSKVFTISAIIGVVGLAATVGLGAAEGDGFRHFGFSYLVNFAFFLAISLGALVFLPINYLTKASWSIVWFFKSGFAMLRSSNQTPMGRVRSRRSG